MEVDYLLLLADGERHYGFQQELIPGEAPNMYGRNMLDRRSFQVLCAEIHLDWGIRVVRDGRMNDDDAIVNVRDSVF